MNTTIETVVNQYFEAWNTKDSSKFPLSDDFTFDGPMGSYDTPEAFKQMADQIFPVFGKVTIMEPFFKDDRACIMVETDTPIVGSFVSVDYFVVKGGKIQHSTAHFDPRKLVDFMESQAQSN